MTTSAAHAQNQYKADLREYSFALFEQFGLRDILAEPPFDGFTEEDVKMLLSECYRFSCDVLGPLNRIGDEHGSRLENGAVVTAPGFKEAWNKLYEAGWKSLGVSPEYDGQGAPKLVQYIAEEMMSGANAAFNLFPGLAYGAAELIEECGTAEQRERYCANIYKGKWGGTMCLTEPEAGSDVGAARTRAKRNADGTYSISGTKVFISSGDSDMVDNIIHLVLARIEGAPPGTKGLSLFIVPKMRVDATGAVVGSNDVVTGGLEHKMGIRASTTCVLNFGENNACIGELVGGIENMGMSQMFKMMNGARIFVGIQGLSVAAAAYLNALSYARERKQGPSIKNFKDPSAPKVPILEHADVRRMLLDMKARVEGIRALELKLGMHLDWTKILAGKDDAKVAEHQGQVEILTPLVKAYGSDQAFRICETAMQTLGGAGYISDYGVEQHCRDAKIFSIYEGTNHIQAMDLVSRKLGQKDGAHMQKFLGDIAGFASNHATHPTLGSCIDTLSQAQKAVAGAATKLFKWTQTGKLHVVPLYANRFLEMMSETAVAWLLLDAAVIADSKLNALDPNHPDVAFYQGKIASATYFARNVLPSVMSKESILASEDETAITMSDASFATI